MRLDKPVCLTIRLLFGFASDSDKLNQSMLFRWDLNVRNPIDAIFVGVDEDGSDGKAKEDESAKEGDLPDRDEPGVWLYNHTYNTTYYTRLFQQVACAKKTPCNERSRQDGTSCANCVTKTPAQDDSHLKMEI